MQQLRCRRKIVGVQALWIDIGHRHLKTQQRRALRHRTVNVSGADQHQPRAQAMYANIDRHRPTAIGADRIAAAARHPPMKHARRFFAERFQRLFNHFALNHAASDGADYRTIFTN